MTRELNTDLDDAPDSELSNEVVTDHYAGMLAAAINKTGLGEVVETQTAFGQIHLLCRVAKEKQADWVHKIGYNMLLAKKEGGFELFFGNEYFLRNGALRYAWMISCGSKDVQDMVSRLCLSIDAVIPRREVLEAPLLGPGTPQSGNGKKGAALVR